MNVKTGTEREKDVSTALEISLIRGDRVNSNKHEM